VGINLPIVSTDEAPQRVPVRSGIRRLQRQRPEQEPILFVFDANEARRERNPQAGAPFRFSIGRICEEVRGRGCPHFFGDFGGR
jgi:hypothetical protein